MEKTWMPTVAGILDIIAGVLGFPFGLMFVMATSGATPVEQRIALSLSTSLMIVAVLAVVGGICALQRKRWALALAGSIAALWPVLLPGIASIIFTARSKNEFPLREHIQMGRTSSGLTENVAGLLCYFLGWVTGLVFILIERKGKFVRFHAMQSIIVFAALTIPSLVIFFYPFRTPGTDIFFYWLILPVGLALWIALMVMAYRGTKFKLPWLGNLAEKWAG